MSQPAASLHLEKVNGGSRVAFSGRLNADGAGLIWREAMQAAALPGPLEADFSKVDYMDGAGIGLLLDLRRKAGGRLGVTGLKPEFGPLLKPFEEEEIPQSMDCPARKDSLIVYLGRLSNALAADLRAQIGFFGHLLVLFGLAIVKPSIVRWKDVWINFQKVGNDALLIVGLIGFLMGLIMAFQASIPLAQFGVQIFIVNLVGLAMLRELGAIMTAIVLAGRSGSAFAAEIGTMKVNEEINALTTMGLDPARFLVLPRVLAGTLAAPVLTVYANLIGVFGGLLVVNLIGFSWSAIWTQFVAAVTISDLMAGMIKSFLFGFLVSMIGCLRGLQTKKGALAVGESTTRAVVAGIILIILTDGIFAVVFYAIGF